LSLELLVGYILNSPPFLNASVPCPHFSYANEEVFQAVDAFELGSQAMVEIETQTEGIEYIVWFSVDWMFWRFLLNLKGQCTKHREFPPPLSPPFCFLFGLELPRSCQRLREIKRWVVYENTVCYLKFDTLWNAWSRVWSRPRVTFPLFAIGLRRSWKRKTIQYGGISQFWRRFRAYFGIKGTMNTPSMPLVGFQP